MSSTDVWDLNALCDAFLLTFAVPRRPETPVICKPRIYEDKNERWRYGRDAKNYYTFMDPQNVGRAKEGIHRGYK
jgi:hypothetical protein